MSKNDDKKDDTDRQNDDSPEAEENNRKRKIVSSEKQDASKALDYWTDEEMARAKPRAMPEKDPEDD